MYGMIINKYCNVCKKEFEINISRCLMGPAKTGEGPDEEYYVGIRCPQCGENLSKDTEKEVQKLRENGATFAVCML